MEKFNFESLDLKKYYFKKIKELFPEVIVDGRIDFDILKDFFYSENILDESSNEKYSFTWSGKNNAKKIIKIKSTGTLLPLKNNNLKWEKTSNIYIEGDNLEVLKLLQKSYINKIKMIYIDPPYNTGKDFVYPDNFKDNLKNYLQITGQLGENGQKLSTNSDSSGRYHSDWLNMIYPRLRLARNLLADDGILFISIDDNEEYNLKKICNEIFGENNYLGSIIPILNPRGSQSSKGLAVNHEYILVYRKTEKAELNGFGLTEEQKIEYNKSDDFGNYREIGLRKRGADSKREDSPTMFYPIYYDEITNDISLEEKIGYEKILPKLSDGSDGRWRWGKEKVLKDKNQLLVRLVKRKENLEFDIFQKDYLTEDKKRKAMSVWLDKELNNEVATEMIRNLFDNKKVFDYTKSNFLLLKLLQISTNLKEGDIILDFFSGSATTAHATMQLNAEDGGNRKYIMVQLPEPTPENSEAAKAGYKNICEIGKERIRRAGEKIKADETLPLENREKLDTGFKVFKLDTSNIKEWDSETKDLKQSLFDSVDNIKSDRTSLDVLYEILLKYGLDLNVPIVENKDFYSIGGGTLLVNLNKTITLDVIDSICKEYKMLLEIDEDYKTTVVLRDSSFKNDIDKTNAIQKLKQAGIKEIRSI
ncbi:MAG: site-specific DNA-methyltransferase [Cetobacterium sp.]